jgi:two-component system response regulator FlrC
MVDDEELIRRLAGGMARRMNVDLTAVGTAFEALQAVQSDHFDVLVADVLLGEGTDGIDLARQIAAAQSNLAVVLMSGYSASHFELTGLPANTQFLTKPFSSESLAHCLIVARERARDNEH